MSILCYNIATMGRKGFTLLELLLVIAIIGILSTVVVANLKQLKAKARDAVRLSDVTQVQKAVEFYYQDHGSYPNPNCYNLIAIGDCASAISPGDDPDVDKRWISDLNIILPNDPIHGTEGAISDYDDAVHTYILTRDINDGVPTTDYYYILFKREAGEQTDNCNNHNPWPGWSCIGGGTMP